MVSPASLIALRCVTTSRGHMANHVVHRQAVFIMDSMHTNAVVQAARVEELLAPATRHIASPLRRRTMCNCALLGCWSMLSRFAGVAVGTHRTPCSAQAKGEQPRNHYAQKRRRRRCRCRRLRAHTHTHGSCKPSPQQPPAAMFVGLSSCGHAGEMTRHKPERQ